MTSVSASMATATKAAPARRPQPKLPAQCIIVSFSASISFSIDLNPRVPVYKDPMNRLDFSIGQSSLDELFTPGILHRAPLCEAPLAKAVQHPVIRIHRFQCKE